MDTDALTAFQQALTEAQQSHPEFVQQLGEITDRPDYPDGDGLQNFEEGFQQIGQLSIEEARLYAWQESIAMAFLTETVPETSSLVTLHGLLYDELCASILRNYDVDFNSKDYMVATGWYLCSTDPETQTTH